MDKRYTAGELAWCAGVSARTVRFYEEKGILQPRERSGEGYRLYDDSAILRLQEILMLKYLGLSLEEIRQTLQQGENLSVAELMAHQKGLILEKRSRLDCILEAIERTEKHCREERLPVARFVEIMQLVTGSQQVDFRYNLYERYGTCRQRWHEWLYEQLPLKPGMRILDVGCGHGNVWVDNWQRIPAGCQITLLDRETRGLQFLHGFYLENRKQLAEGVSFSFFYEDAEVWDCPVGEYDLILAGHLWNYIRDRKALLQKMHRGLTERGRLFSTFSSRIAVEDVNRILEPVLHKRVLEGYEKRQQVFTLEMEELLTKEFGNVSRKDFHNGLRIDEPEKLLQYFCQIDGELEQQIRAQGQVIRRQLQELLRQERVPEIGITGCCYRNVNGMVSQAKQDRKNMQEDGE